MQLLTFFFPSHFSLPSFTLLLPLLTNLNIFTTFQIMHAKRRILLAEAELCFYSNIYPPPPNICSFLGGLTWKWLYVNSRCVSRGLSLK